MLTMNLSTISSNLKFNQSLLHAFNVKYHLYDILNILVQGRVTSSTLQAFQFLVLVAVVYIQRIKFSWHLLKIPCAKSIS